MNRKPTRALLALFLSASVFILGTHAQDKPDAKSEPPAKPVKSSSDFRVYEEQLKTTDCAKMPTRTAESDCTYAHIQRYFIPVKNAASQNDINEILVAVRNVFDPSLKIFMSTSQSEIALATYPEEYERIEKFIRTLDQPHPVYRVTFTLTESDAGKRVGVQHFTVICASGQKTTFKQGSKVPVVTGSYKEGGNGTQSQFTYLDIGVNIETTVIPVGNGVQMKLKVEQSSASEQSEIGGVREPVVRQSVFDGTPSMPLGKATAVAQLDNPGSTRHVDIDALVEPI